MCCSRSSLGRIPFKTRKTPSGEPMLKAFSICEGNDMCIEVDERRKIFFKHIGQQLRQGSVKKNSNSDNQ